MTNFKTIGILSLATLGLFPLAASANTGVINTQDATYVATSGSYSDSSTELSTKPSKIVIVEKQQQKSVQPAGYSAASVEGYRVQDNQGQVFINRTLSQSELTPFNSNVRVIDSYEFSHEGVTYQNKIIEN